VELLRLDHSRNYYDSEEEKVTLLSFVLEYNIHIIHYINNLLKMPRKLVDYAVYE
jgi:hypothetical protein